MKFEFKEMNDLYNLVLNQLFGILFYFKLQKVKMRKPLC